MNQNRHASNILYRQVADQLGLETVRQEQESVTGKPVSLATAQRYYNGYGEYQAIPNPGFVAALRLTEATFAALRILSESLTATRIHNARVYGKKR